MNLTKILSLSKLLSVSMGFDSKQILTKLDVDLGVEALKEFADKRNGWTDEDKTIYKTIANFVKERYQIELEEDMNGES